jgi:hypothetical protein
MGIVRIAMPTGREVLITNGDAKDARIHQLESEVTPSEVGRYLNTVAPMQRREK